jgi:hypothetical protein
MIISLDSVQGRLFAPLCEINYANDPSPNCGGLVFGIEVYPEATKGSLRKSNR